MRGSPATSKAGNMSIIMMGTMALLALIIGGVVDYASLANEKRELQGAADGASLAAARELVVTSPDAIRIQAVADAYIRANFHGEDIKVEAGLGEKRTSVVVKVTAAPKVYFPGPIGQNAGPVPATAEAGTYGGGSVCMIGLSASAKSTLNMAKSATITADGCAIYSNSKDMKGITIADNASVTASFVCSAGGVDAKKKSAVNPTPVTDCPTIDDPLGGRAEPSVGPCTFTKMEIKAGTSAALDPGVYCGGLKINGTVTVSPGVYIISGGPLTVDKGGSLIGEHVGFFFTGKDALMNFEKDSTIDLSGPRTGVMSGLLFFESRKVTAADGGTPPLGPPPPDEPPKEHRIRSNNARQLEGTIYLSRNRLLIDGDKPVADHSDYTVIVAREFALNDGPAVVLNSRYALSDVPVPDGVGNKATAKTRLVH